MKHVVLVALLVTASAFPRSRASTRVGIDIGVFDSRSRSTGPAHDHILDATKVELARRRITLTWSISQTDTPRPRNPP